MTGSRIEQETGKGTFQGVFEIIVVTSPACHFCEDAVEALDELGTAFPLSVRIVDIRSDEGAAIEREHRPPMPPFVLIDGKLFSFGRLPRRKLRRLLSEGAG